MDKQLAKGLIVGAVVAVAAGGVAGVKLMHPTQQYAEVLGVKPIVHKTRTPRQECHDEAVTRQAPVKDEHQIIGTVAGAVIGGVIGHQIGGGTGKELATVAGAAGGGYAGNRVQKNLQDRDTVTSTEQRCETVYDTAEKEAGYEVRYRFDGKVATVHMDRDPGPRLPMHDGKPVTDAGSAAQKGG